MTMNVLRTAMLLVLLTMPLANNTSCAEDWPQWLGVRRDSVWRETGLIDRFPADGPRLVWRQKVAYGYAGPAVAAGRVFVADFQTDVAMPEPEASRRHTLPGVERVLCLSTQTGEVLWKHEDPCTYHLSFPYGPRVTPTVDQDRVYTLGAEGHLLCLKVADGSVMWSKQLTQDYQCETPMWGFAGHPLVDGDRLICLVGGTGSVAVAFNKLTGQEIWRACRPRNRAIARPR